MLGCRPMPAPKPELPETRERRCPACHSEEIMPVGHVVAGERAHQGGAPMRDMRDRVLVRPKTPRLSAGRVSAGRGPPRSRSRRGEGHPEFPSVPGRDHLFQPSAIRARSVG